MVETTILQGLPSPDKIYTNANYGLDTISKLYFWVKASTGGATSTEYEILMNQFGLTTAQMDQVIGEKSLMHMIITTVSYNIGFSYRYRF